MIELTQEQMDKYEEYRMVAALAVQEVSLLHDVIHMYDDLTIDGIKEHIDYCHERIQQFTQDKQLRERTFNSMSLLFSAARAGMIQSTPL